MRRAWVPARRPLEFGAPVPTRHTSTSNFRKEHGQSEAMRDSGSLPRSVLPAVYLPVNCQSPLPNSSFYLETLRLSLRLQGCKTTPDSSLLSFFAKLGFLSVSLEPSLDTRSSDVRGTRLAVTARACAAIVPLLRSRHTSGNHTADIQVQGWWKGRSCILSSKTAVRGRPCRQPDSDPAEVRNGPSQYRPSCEEKSRRRSPRHTKRL